MHQLMAKPNYENDLKKNNQNKIPESIHQLIDFTICFGQNIYLPAFVLSEF
jgi:hypothetical protein